MIVFQTEGNEREQCCLYRTKINATVSSSDCHCELCNSLGFNLSIASIDTVKSEGRARENW
jgi:hypothetical protein